MARRNAVVVLDLLPIALRIARKEAGLDVEKAATAAGVSSQTIIHSEQRGRPYPALETFFSLLDAYAVSLRDLDVLLDQASQVPLERRLNRLEKRIGHLEAMAKRK